ncbi:MAG: HEAT repeat domain-containing protein [Myxococcales bacterium]|nr:HEAT repeat domain-containing protein [Myxococcales bacterium]
MTSPLSLSDAERRRVGEVEALLRARQAGALIERLIDPSWAVRRSVIASLALLGDDAVGPLCEVLLRHRDDEDRLAAAVDALVASSGDVDAAVLALARADEPAVVCDAAQILGRRRSAAAVPELARLVQETSDNVALAAIEAVGRIGGQQAVDLLIAAVESRNFFRTFPAIDVLGRTGDPRAVGPLAALLGEPHYAIEAARALGRTGQPSAAPALVAMLLRPIDAQVRAAAAALVEIHDRHAARFGPHSAIPEALARTDARTVTRRLGQALAGADAAERAALGRVLGWIGGPRSVQMLVELLDGEPEVAEAATTSLAGFGGDAEPLLLSALHAGPAARRLLLLPLLARRRTSAGEVVPCLDDPDPEVRAAACDALGKIGDPSAVPALFVRLSDPDARVAQCAVAAVQSLGGEQTERLALEIARSPEPRLRRAGLRILAYFGWASAIELFLDAVGEADDRISDVGAFGLALIDDPRAISGLLAAARHPSPRTRAAAVRALGQTHGERAARECLHASLTDPDAWVRYYACQALSRLQDESAVAAIGALSADPAGHVRLAAVEALARLRGEQALGALQAAANSSDPDLRRAALVALGSVKSEASRAILKSAVASDDPATRLVAISALAEFEGSDVVEVLGEAAADRDPSVSSAAIGLLGARAGNSATLALLRRVPDPSLHEQVVTALSNAQPGRIQTLVTELGAAGIETAPLLVSALARMRLPEAATAMEVAFELENPIARRALAPALAASPSRRARALLERAASSDSDPDVRRTCAAVLGR